MNISRGIVSVLVLSLLSFISACGRSGNSIGYEGQTDRCSSKFREDFNKISEVTDQAEKLESARAFNQKYNGVKCIASAKYDDTGEESTLTIDSKEEMDRIIRSSALPKLNRVQEGEEEDQFEKLIPQDLKPRKTKKKPTSTVPPAGDAEEDTPKSAVKAYHLVE